MTARRSRISSELMEELQVLKYSLRKRRDLNFTEGMKWEEELEEFESLAEGSVPEDVRSYIRSLADPVTVQ